MVRRVAVLLLLALGAAHPAVAAERQVPATAADVQLSFAPVVKRVAPAVVEGRWDEAADPQLDVVAYTAPPRERAHGRTRRGPAMEYVGIDLHKKESQICLLTETGEVIERRIRTEPQRFAEVLGGRPRARILVEASTESEWVARCLEGLGARGRGGRPELRADVCHADPEGQDRSAGRPGAGRRPVCSARTAPRIGCPTRSGMCGAAWRCAMPWSGRAPGTSP